MISERKKQQSFVRKPGEERSCHGHSVTRESGPYEVRIESVMKQH